MRSWKTFGKRLAILCGALFLAFALIEVGVLLLLGEQVKFPRHVVGSSFGLRINEPNATYRHQSPDVSVWFRINSKGLRSDVEYPYEKPAGVKRIVSLGDSFTIGYEVDVEETFSSVLEQELSSRGYAVQVLNAGVSGYSNAEELLYLERELLRYEPDLVLVSFYSNDLRDNIRSNLFHLEDGQLVQKAEEYVPLGAFADFLNRNPVLSFLSAYSNAFALSKERMTRLLKRRKVAENASELGFVREVPKDRQAYPARLAAAIFRRMADLLRDRRIPLVIHVIPNLTTKGGAPALNDAFPYAHFDAEQEGVTIVSAAEHLKPHLGEEPLYHRRSHGHWTPFAHRIAGHALAEHIAGMRLLEPAAPPEEAVRHSN